MKGKKVKLEEPEQEMDSGVLDLMSRLKASLEKGNGKKTARTKSSKKITRASRRKTT